MLTQWIPISPDVNEKGNFIALSHLSNSEELFPVKEGNKQEYNQLKITQNQVDANLAFKLGLFNSLSVDTSSKVFAFCYEAVIYSEVTTQNPIGDIIYGTRYGTGYRIMLKVSNLEANASLSITSIAAEATLRRAQVEFELHGFGFPNNASILVEAPDPGDFNVDTWAEIKAYTTKLKAFLKENYKDLQPKPYSLLIDPQKVINTTAEFQSHLYAYNKISKRIKLEEALKEVNGKYKVEIVKQVYRSIGIQNNDQPTIDQSNSASKIMNI